MPVSSNIQILIDNQVCDLPNLDENGIHFNYSLEDPENFQTKQGATSFGIDLPATPTNDRIFGTFYDQDVKDMTGTEIFSGWRSCSIRVDGIEIMRGCAVMIRATHTDIPETYSLEIYSQNGDWVILADNLTVWDCLNTASHTFDVATVEASWTNFDSDEFHDYVYAPVRYRQPFDGSALVDSTGKSLGLGIDDACNIYHLRPSISIYWLLVRGFRQLGYSINSQFLSTASYFRRMVMPWTAGDFYDLNSQLEQGLCVKVAGEITTEAPSGTGPFWSGANSNNASLIGSPGGSSFWGFTQDGFTSTSFDPLSGPASFSNGVAGKGIVGCSANGINATGGVYVFSGNGTSGAGNDWFKMDINYPPNGADDFLLYSFDEATGTMIYNFNPPALLAPIMSNVSITFTISLYLIVTGTDNAAVVGLECTQIPTAGPTSVTCVSIVENGGSLIGTLTYPDGMDPRYPLIPTVFNFTVQGLNPGEQLRFRIRCLSDTLGLGGLGGYKFGYFTGAYLNKTAAAYGIPAYHFNAVTERYDYSFTDSIWTPLNSTLTMNEFLLQLGGNVNFQDYDKFRSYRFLDLLKGVVDMFNLSIQTDPISRIVTIEPTHDYVLPDGTKMQGYFVDKIQDWTDKHDITKASSAENYREPNRQFDFQLQQDGSDGGQNIFAGRYKGIYLNNAKATIFNNVNSTNNENGLMAAIPGASRYMFPDRFPRGSNQHINNLFSAVMHYKHSPWGKITVILSGGTDPALAPQLICIFPENINGSSADAIQATFAPKMAFYAGPQNQNACGGFRWMGDPNAGGNNMPTYNDARTGAHAGISAIGFQLPLLFSVDYTGRAPSPGEQIPILSYCDQNINGVVKAGLMKSFFLKRLAIMRAGKMYKAYMRLKLSDITDWEHRYSIKIGGSIYYLVGIQDYNAASDESCLCIFWRKEFPNQNDLSNMFPSNASVATSMTILPQYDLKYAQMLLFYRDLPIID